MLDGAAQVHQLAVEEMAGLGHADQFGRLFQRVDPVVHGLRLDDLVFLALDHQPRTRGGRDRSEIPPACRRRDRHQCIRLQAVAGAQRHVGAEAEARQPQLGAGTLGAHPGDDGAQVVHFAIAMVEQAGRSARAAEVEAHGHRTEFAQAARGHHHHLVVHGAAFRGQGMADHRGDRLYRLAVFRPVDMGFQRPFGAVQGDRAGRGGKGRSRHAAHDKPCADLAPSFRRKPEPRASPPDA